MPVIQVEALPQAAGVDLEQALAALCVEVAAVLGEDPSGTWATWRTLDHYDEKGRSCSLPPRTRRVIS